MQTHYGIGGSVVERKCALLAPQHVGSLMLLSIFDVTVDDVWPLQRLANVAGSQGARVR
jgi:hypothetical protein